MERDLVKCAVLGKYNTSADHLVRIMLKYGRVHTEVLYKFGRIGCNKESPDSTLYVQNYPHQLFVHFWAAFIKHKQNTDFML